MSRGLNLVSRETFYLSADDEGWLDDLRSFEWANWAVSVTLYQHLTGGWCNFPPSRPPNYILLQLTLSVCLLARHLIGTQTHTGSHIHTHTHTRTHTLTGGFGKGRKSVSESSRHKHLRFVRNCCI